MKKLTNRYVSVLLVLMPLLALSKTVTVEKAHQVARNVYLERCAQLNPSASDQASLSWVFTEYSGTTPLYHVFQAAGQKGFVIVSADDRAYPVLGYSSYGSFPVNAGQRPPAFQAWLDRYSAQIAALSGSGSGQDESIGQVWDKYSVQGMDLLPSVVTDTLILTTKWGQGCYYNELCPAVSCTDNCNHAAAGCGAIAAAQILKYLQYPPKGMGAESYTDPASPGCSPPESSLGTQSVDFSAHTYDWSQMPDVATTSNAETAKLIYDLGVGNKSNFSCCETFSYPDTTRKNLAYHFGMDYNITLAVKSMFSNSDWESMIIYDIQNHSPVLYRGELATGAGHGWVCYGYQTTPSGNMFLFNWGWDGMADGFYYLNDITPAPGVSFNYVQAAIFGIKPGDDLMFTNGDISQSSLNPGSNFTVTYTVLNQGVGPAPPAYVKVYFSQNTTFEPGIDIEAASTLLPLLDTAATQTVTQAVTVPSGLSSGTWYVLLVIDPDNLIREVFEANNSGYFPVQIGSLNGLNESFEGDFLPAGWMKYNPDGGSGWNQQSVGTTPVPGWQAGTLTALPDGTGGSKMAFCTWSTGGSTYNDQWLVTPLVNIAAGYELSFWFGSYAGYIDTVDVLLSTTNNQMSSFTTLLTKLTFSMVNSGWVYHTVNLASYAGQNIFVAFREHVADNYYNGTAQGQDRASPGIAS
ncbi:MAG: C10 family peptidase [Bacteroidetes bacterium]|nr:C10 family peptidase [Bacteroidota bacterium]